MAENNGLILASDLSGNWGCSDQTRCSCQWGVPVKSRRLPARLPIEESACPGGPSLSPNLDSSLSSGKFLENAHLQVLLESVTSKGLGWRLEIVCFYFYCFSAEVQIQGLEHVNGGYTQSVPQPGLIIIFKTAWI